MKLYDAVKVFDAIAALPNSSNLTGFVSFPEKDDEIHLIENLRGFGVVIVSDPMKANLIITFGGVSKRPTKCLYIEVMDDGQVEVFDSLTTIH